MTNNGLLILFGPVLILQQRPAYLILLWWLLLLFLLERNGCWSRSIAVKPKYIQVYIIMLQRLTKYGRICYF
jgi:hypothetical protein